MFLLRIAASVTMLASCCGASMASEKIAFSADEIAFFESKIRPVLDEKCYSCHSAASKSLKAGLKLDSRAGLLAGGDSGPAVVPGDTDESLLLAAIRYQEYEMPPSGKLADSTIADFERWIARSVAWPDEPEPTAESAPVQTFALHARKQSHWAWQPLTDPVPPSVSGGEHLSPIDQFVIAKLHAAGLEPAPPVDDAALSRRLSFDIVGLPPMGNAVDVDSLLASPHYGERWGRHWLDLVRYAESRGHEFDPDAPAAYQYRDYLIRALNDDVPYDQLVREHIAGDLLAQPRCGPKGADESVLGTGFWFLGEWVHSPVDVRKDETDRFDNMIDCFSKAFLGLTVSCARCHDHKFDAISTEDYYALSGVMQSSHFRNVRFETLPLDRQVARELAELDSKYRSLLDAATKLESADTSLAGPIKLPPIPVGHRLVFDYTDPHDPNSQRVYPDGFAYRSEPTRAGEWVVDSRDKKQMVLRSAIGSVRNDPFWDVIQVASDASVNGRRSSSPEANGRGVRTPTFTVSGGIVSILCRGVGSVFACVDSHRLVVGPLHGETIQKVEPANDNSLRWLTLDLKRYVGHGVQLELVPADHSLLELLQVIDSDTKPSIDTSAANKIYQQSYSLESTTGLHEVESIMSRWLSDREALQQKIRQASHLAMAMMDGVGEDDHLLIRGNSSAPGKIVRRRFLTAINPVSLGDEQSSGRLELADQVTSPTNPLYARVIVNRVWHHLLGRGIVPTVDDFGVLGQRPTHSELLDHLASWFLRDGQSIKRLIRYIVSSQTYRASGQLTEHALQVDAGNQLYHHRPPKRLEAEVIRDSLLAVSGSLDQRLFGESVPVHLTDFLDGRGRPSQSGPVDGDRRRSIYLGIRRNFISPMMSAFDTPVPFSTMGRRTVSNVPAQALMLMNDTFVGQIAKSWAESLIQAHPQDLRERVRLLYQSAYGRVPIADEVDLILHFARHHDSESNAWTDVTLAVINSKEFIFIP